MKKGTISERIENEFKISKVIYKRRMIELCGGKCGNTAGIIESMIKRGFKIKVVRDEEGLFIEKYIFVSYEKPFYLIAREIERSNPRLEKLIRLLYGILI